jgi:hypothetical protein
MLHNIIKDIRAVAERCKSAASDCSDKELSDYLREVNVILHSIASVLTEQFDQ